MGFSIAKGILNNFLLTQYHLACNMHISVMELPSSWVVQGPVSFWPCEGWPGGAAVGCAYNTWGTFQPSQMSAVPTPARGRIFCSATRAPQSDRDFTLGFLGCLHNMSQTIKVGNKF